MLGNDIVSLADLRPRSAAREERFMQKISRQEEMDPLRTLLPRSKALWALWAVKESAYKVFIQAGGASGLLSEKTAVQTRHF